jgi:hypothetical protein
LHSGAQHIAFDVHYRLGLCKIKSFAAQYPTPHDCCVRFAAPVTGNHATLARGRLATALPPPDFHRLESASFAWRTVKTFSSNSLINNERTPQKPSNPRKRVRRHSPVTQRAAAAQSRPAAIFVGDEKSAATARTENALCGLAHGREPNLSYGLMRPQTRYETGQRPQRSALIREALYNANERRIAE